MKGDDLKRVCAVVERNLAGQECNHTLHHAEKAAGLFGLDWSEVRPALEDRGGGCDCEVLLNVAPSLAEVAP